MKDENKADWTIPDGDIIRVPDRLDDVFNRMGHYLRVHTISGINEFQAIAYMTKFCDEYASQQTASLQKQVEELKDQNIKYFNVALRVQGEYQECQKQVEERSQRIAQLEEAQERVKDICANQLGNFVSTKDVLEALNPQDNQKEK